MLARERRWSACRVALQSFMLWHGLVLAGALWHEQDFGRRGLMNGYVVATVTGLVGMDRAVPADGSAIASHGRYVLGRNRTRAVDRRARLEELEEIFRGH